MRGPPEDGWNPIESAPFDEDVTLQVTDGRGQPYAINWPCRRTAAGWINSRKGKSAGGYAVEMEAVLLRTAPMTDTPSTLRGANCGRYAGRSVTDGKKQARLGARLERRPFCTSLQVTYAPNSQPNRSATTYFEWLFLSQRLRSRDRS
jgi:hypothetical protein